MKLVSLNADQGPSVGLAVDDNRIIDLQPLGESFRSMRTILENGEDALHAVRSVSPDRQQAPGEPIGLKDADLLPPVPNPKLILSVGLNYWKHLEEMEGTPVPKHPAAFIKTRDSLLGSGKPVTAPNHCPDMMDYEGELCVVMGKRCHNVDASEAMDAVAGYTIANDISARNWVHEVFEAEGTFPAIHAWERNINGKQLPGFTPCGPVFVTKEEIPDPHDLHMETRLNGEVMQSTGTDDMIFKIPDLIAYYSQWFRFNPGDIITTGSPAGVGFGRDPKVFMKSGDIVEVEVEGIGRLTNSISQA